MTQALSSLIDIPGIRVLGRLGQGGMGDVYLAEETTLGRQVAVKVLPSKMALDGQAAARFLREARALATIEHPRVVRVYGFGEHKGTAYLVMEYVRGETLAERIRRLGGLPIDEALRILAEAVDGLEAACEKGIVHRDVKPSNILLDRRDGVHVADFGLAKPIGAGAEEALTQTGLMQGTPHYISPEQARGETVDLRSDVYSLGIVLYEMLVGSRPFQGKTPAEIVARQLRDRLPPLLERRPDTPPALCRLVEQMTEKDPGDRPASYSTLKGLIAGARIAEPPQPHQPSAGPATRLATHPAAIPRWAVGVGFGLALAAVVTVTVAYRRAAAVVEEAVPVSRLDTSDATLDSLRRTARGAAIEVSIEAGPGPRLGKRPKSVVVKGRKGSLSNGRSLIEVVDALSGTRFFEEASLMRGGGASPRRITFSLQRMPLAGFINMMAAATGWPVVQDHSVDGDVTLRLTDVPWDQAVRTVFEAKGLSTMQHGSVWLVGTQARVTELLGRQPPALAVLRLKGAAPEAAMLALEGARTEAGVVAFNRRLDAALIVDRPAALGGYSAALTTIKGLPAYDLSRLDDTYTGSPLTLMSVVDPAHLDSAAATSFSCSWPAYSGDWRSENDLVEYFRFMADFSGLNWVVAPKLRAKRAVPETEGSSPRERTTGPWWWTRCLGTTSSTPFSSLADSPTRSRTS